MLKSMLIAVALTGCANEAAPEPDIQDLTDDAQPYLWQCGGDKLYFEWKCNTAIGAWEKNFLGDEFWSCGYPPIHTLEGRRGACHQSEKYACGGGDDDQCNIDDTCTFPPLTPCTVVSPPLPPDPGPCCFH